MISAKRAHGPADQVATCAKKYRGQVLGTRHLELPENEICLNVLIQAFHFTAGSSCPSPVRCHVDILVYKPRGPISHQELGAVGMVAAKTDVVEVGRGIARCVDRFLNVLA